MGICRASLVARMVKNLPVVQETRLDPLEKSMATHSVFLPREFHEQRRLAGYSSWGCKELDPTEQLTKAAKLLALAMVVVVGFQSH